MATIAAGQISGFSRAGRTGVFLPAFHPDHIAATGYDLFKYLRPGHDEGALAPAHIDSHGWALLAIGFFVSFVVAYVVVAWFMNWVRRRGFVPFAIYRLIVGGAVVAWALHGAH